MKTGDLNSPRSQTEALENLWGAVFFQALKDDDPQWLESNDYFLVAELAGISAPLASKVKRMMLAGEITREQFKDLAPAVPNDPLIKTKTDYAPRSFNSVAKIREIAEAMYSENSAVTAPEIKRACIAVGIKASTAYSQAWKWLKERELISNQMAKNH